MRRVSFLAVLTFISALAIPASASVPMDVRFEVPTSFGQPVTAFTATGPAVDAGIVCATGTVTDVARSASGPTAVGINFQVVKSFTCGDGSGSFLVKLQVRLTFAPNFQDNFQWVVVGGDGAYSKLHGGGPGVGIDPGENFIRDVYTGRLHTD